MSDNRPALETDNAIVCLDKYEYIETEKTVQSDPPSFFEYFHCS